METSGAWLFTEWVGSNQKKTYLLYEKQVTPKQIRREKNTFVMLKTALRRLCNSFLETHCLFTTSLDIGNASRLGSLQVCKCTILAPGFYDVEELPVCFFYSNFVGDLSIGSARLLARPPEARGGGTIAIHLACHVFLGITSARALSCKKKYVTRCPQICHEPRMNRGFA